MNTENILSILCTLGNYSKQEAEKYSTLVTVNCYPFSEKEYDEKDRALLEYYIAAKTNYQIVLSGSHSEISSFSAGDISVSTSSADVKSNAKLLFENAYADVAHLADDKGFYFRGV